MRKIAKFTLGTDGIYYPSDKEAIAATAVVSRRFLRDDNIQMIRSAGWVPCLMNGQEIGKIDVKV